MDPIAEYKFTVGEQYENEKGIFSVVSIHKQDMLIRWEDGREIMTDINLQGRIQKRKQQEKIASEPKPKNTRSKPSKGSKIAD